MLHNSTFTISNDEYNIHYHLDPSYPHLFNGELCDKKNIHIIVKTDVLTSTSMIYLVKFILEYSKTDGTSSIDSITFDTNSLNILLLDYFISSLKFWKNSNLYKNSNFKFILLRIKNADLALNGNTEYVFLNIFKEFKKNINFTHLEILNSKLDMIQFNRNILEKKLGLTVNLFNGYTFNFVTEEFEGGMHPKEEGDTIKKNEEKIDYSTLFKQYDLSESEEEETKETKETKEIKEEQIERKIDQPIQQKIETIITNQNITEIEFIPIRVKINKILNDIPEDEKVIETTSPQDKAMNILNKPIDEDIVFDHGMMEVEDIQFNSLIIQEFFNDEPTLEILKKIEGILFKNCIFQEKEDANIFFESLKIFIIKKFKFENMYIFNILYMKNPLFSTHQYNAIVFENCTGFDESNFKIFEVLLPILPHLMQLSIINCDIKLKWLNDLFLFVQKTNKKLPLKKLNLSKNILFNETNTQSDLDILFKFILSTKNLTKVNLSGTGIPLNYIEEQKKIILNVHPIKIETEIPLSFSKDYPEAKIMIENEINDNNNNNKNDLESPSKHGLGLFKNSLIDLKDKLKITKTDIKDKFKTTSAELKDKLESTKNELKDKFNTNNFLKK